MKQEKISQYIPNRRDDKHVNKINLKIKIEFPDSNEATYFYFQYNIKKGLIIKSCAWKSKEIVIYTILTRFVSLSSLMSYQPFLFPFHILSLWTLLKSLRYTRSMFLFVSRDLSLCSDFAFTAFLPWWAIKVWTSLTQLRQTISNILMCSVSL